MSKSSPFQFEKLEVKDYCQINGKHEKVEIIGEFPEFNVMLTFHIHFADNQCPSIVQEWDTRDFSLLNIFELNDTYKSMQVVHKSDSPILMAGKRNEIEFFRYAPTYKILPLKRFQFIPGNDTAYFEFQKIPLENFTYFGVGCFERGFSRFLNKYEIRIFDLKNLKFQRRVISEKKGSVIIPLVLEKKLLLILGTGSKLTFYSIRSWRLLKKFTVTKTKDSIQDVQYMESRDIIILYMRNEQDYMQEARLIFVSIKGFKILKSNVKWISTYNTLRNLYVFSEFEYFCGFADQTTLAFQNLSEIRKSKSLKLPEKSSGVSLFKIANQKQLLVCLARNSNNFFLVVLKY